MQLVEGLEKIVSPYPGAVVTIGNFDGVHKGHQALFQKVRERADARRGTAVVITFEPHPLRVVTNQKTPPLITLYEQKVELISRAGLDVCLCIPFTLEFAAISAAAFVEKELVERIGMKEIVVGEDYAFGKNREGDINFLRSCASRLDFQVVCVNEVTYVGQTRISSTAIRETIQKGDMETAVRLLGRYYQIRGEVVTGRGRGGKMLGFPTANIKLVDELCPLQGVYAVRVIHQAMEYQGIANIGYSPTFDDHLFTVEVHILDFDRNITGSRLQVEFITRLRDEKRFDGIEALKTQIAEDIQVARTILSR